MILFLLCRHSLMKMIHRYDGAPTLPYWRARDLGLEEERFSFLSANHIRLEGSRYWVKGMKIKALVVFFHGLGDGRASYLDCISMLAHDGYLVYAYDNTGCMESEGRTIFSLDRTLTDQKYFFAWLESDPKAQGLSRYAVGHSWGGYGALASALPEYHIKKIVSLAGYYQLSIQMMSAVPKQLHWLKPWLILALRSLIHHQKKNVPASYFLKKSSAEVLYLQGDKDKMVPLSAGYEPLRKATGDNPRMHYCLLPNRGHSLYKTPDAERYVEDCLKQGITHINGRNDIEMDLKRATAPNLDLWKKILDFLNEDSCHYPVTCF